MQINRGDHFLIPKPESTLNIRMPLADDGARIWHLIDGSGALDANSLYCNLLQCSHFAATCALAERDGKVAGWLSGYVPPAQPDTLFVWQVCVAAAARGLGLGKRLVTSVLERHHCADVRHVECTITRTNAASWALFQKVARELDAELTSTPHFLRDRHLDGRHDSEFRVAIGPFAAPAALKARGTGRANGA